MSEDTQTAKPNEGNAAEPKMFTQEQLDNIIKERLARAKAELPSDYQELKEKAAKYDEAQEQAKTDLERALEKVAKLEGEIADRDAREQHEQAVRSAADEYGVDAETLRRMSGDVAENAKFLKEKTAQTYAYPNVYDGGAGSKPSLSKSDILGIRNERERLKAIQDNIELFE